MTTALDIDTVTMWLRLLHGAAPGRRSIVGIDAARTSCRSFGADELDDAADYVQALDAQQVPGIYLRTTTLTLPPGYQGRGGAAHSVALPGLWADVDIAGPGHKHDATKHGGRSLPIDETAARGVVAEAGLPEPTLWVHSGGGLYPWWLLSEPHMVPSDGGTAADLSERWQHLLGAAAARLGLHYGTGVGDLARVLRIPGTVNRKAGLARPCRLAEVSGTPYTFADLLAAAVASETAYPPSTEQSPRASPPPRSTSTTRSAARAGVGPFDVLAEVADWADVFEPAGWEFVRAEGDGAQLWRRPGATSEYSARCGHGGIPTAVVHSDAAGLPSGAGQRLTIGRVYAWLAYGGDERAAARALATGDAIALTGSVAVAVAERFLPRSLSAMTMPTPAVNPTPRPRSRVAFLPGIGDLDPIVAGALAGALSRHPERDTK